MGRYKQSGGLLVTVLPVFFAPVNEAVSTRIPPGAIRHHIHTFLEESEGGLLVLECLCPDER